MDKKAIPLNTNNLPEILKELIAEQKDRGISQRAICKRVGIVESTIKCWKCGYRVPGLYMLECLLEALGKQLAIVDK